MDKSKIGAIAVLLIVGGGLFFAKSQDVPAPNPDPDSAEESADKSAPAATPAFDVVGGVTKLKVEDERVGTGAVAERGDTLSMNYKGTLLNGEVFDQSYGRGPFDFMLGSGHVIAGWDQGIVGMKVGGKRKLTIPASMGYGDQGSPPKIPGKATLIFEVELLNVTRPK
jgi:peptidylprolyl isomerase